MFRNAQQNFNNHFSTVDIDAVWLARDIEQTARNMRNKRKNEPDRYDGLRYTMPELQGRGV